MDGEQERGGERLISYLQQQNCIIDSYLHVLDLEVEDIASGDDVRLRTHALMEGELVRRLEELAHKIDTLPAEERRCEVALSLEAAFERKCSRALEKNRNNQETLQSSLFALRSQLASLERFGNLSDSVCRNNAGAEVSPYHYIDIHP